MPDNLFMKAQTMPDINTTQNQHVKKIPTLFLRQFVSTFSFDILNGWTKCLTIVDNKNTIYG